MPATMPEAIAAPSKKLCRRWARGEECFAGHCQFRHEILTASEEASAARAKAQRTAALSAQRDSDVPDGTRSTAGLQTSLPAEVRVQTVHDYDLAEYPLTEFVCEALGVAPAELSRQHLLNASHTRRLRLLE